MQHERLTLFFLFLLLSLGCLVSIMFFDQDLFDHIPAILISGGTAVAFALLKTIWALYKPEKEDLTVHKKRSPSKKDNSTAEHEESLFQSALFVLAGLWVWVTSSRFVRTVFLIVVFLISSSVTAHAVYEGFPGIRSMIEQKADGSTEANAGDDTPEEAPLDNIKEESPSEQEPPEPEPAPFLSDPERYYTLTEAEENELFFLDGPYKIENWTDPYAIAQQLYPFIEEKRALQIANIFDRDAPDTVKDEIAKVSEQEKDMTNSDQLDNIIEVRIEVWEDYPKRGIACLLANNMQRYACEYDSAGGAYETIKYYYAQSIFWTWKSLSFDYVTPYMLKSDLNYIKMRYHDIADKAANGSEEQKRASALSEAFQILENMEFSSPELSETDLSEDAAYTA